MQVRKMFVLTDLFYFQFASIEDPFGVIATFQSDDCESSQLKTSVVQNTERMNYAIALCIQMNAVNIVGIFINGSVFENLFPPFARPT